MLDFYKQLPIGKQSIEFAKENTKNFKQAFNLARIYAHQVLQNPNDPKASFQAKSGRTIMRFLRRVVKKHREEDTSSSGASSTVGSDRKRSRKEILEFAKDTTNRALGLMDKEMQDLGFSTEANTNRQASLQQLTLDADLARRLAELEGEKKVERVVMEGEEKEGRAVIRAIEQCERKQLITQFREQQEEVPSLDASTQEEQRKLGEKGQRSVSDNENGGPPKPEGPRDPVQRL